MQRVFVLDKNQQPLMPCTPGRARKLLKRGRAAVYRRSCGVCAGGEGGTEGWTGWAAGGMGVGRNAGVAGAGGGAGGTE